MRLALLAAAVCLSVVVHAGQQGDARDRFVTVASTERMLASQSGQPASLSITLDPADQTHTRVVIGGSTSTWTFESAAVSMTYTADGLVIDLRNGTIATNGMAPQPFQTVRLTYKDGEFVRIDLKGTPSQ